MVCSQSQIRSVAYVKDQIMATGYTALQTICLCAFKNQNRPQNHFVHIIEKQNTKWSVVFHTWYMKLN